MASKYSRDNPQPRGDDADYQDQMFGQGANPKPTRGPLSARSASPASNNTSGMEDALGALADQKHPPRRH